MKVIGGYFELELNDNHTVFHDKAVAVNSGRNALEYILTTNKNFEKIFIPYYTCDVILQPIKRLNLDFEFYSLKENLTPTKKCIRKNEVLLYVNYFGIMDKIIKNIINKYKNVIIDNSQAFFSRPINNIPAFYSPRKFFGLPDGGFAYTNQNIDLTLERDKSIDRMAHLLIRYEDGPESGFNLFKENDKKLDNLPLMKISVITERLLKNINFTFVLNRRNENFLYLHKSLRNSNELTPLIESNKINGPMVYPFLKKNNKKLKKKLIRNKIYVATYWPNVYERVSKNSLEYYLTDNLIPLPIDQRYSLKEIKILLKIIGL